MHGAHPINLIVVDLELNIDTYTTFPESFARRLGGWVIYILSYYVRKNFEATMQICKCGSGTSM